METKGRIPLLYIDIETLPSKERPSLEEIKAPSNYKNEEAIQKYKEENQIKAWRDQALHSLKGRIFCIGYAFNDDDVNVICDESEEVMMQELEGIVSLHPICTWVGHNIIDFDAVWIAHRAIKYGLRLLKTRLTPDRANDFIKDTMRMFASPAWHKDHKYSLEDICNFLGTQAKSNMKGDMVFDYYLEGRFDEIKEYCKEDVNAMRQVYKRMVL